MPEDAINAVFRTLEREGLRFGLEIKLKCLALLAELTARGADIQNPALLAQYLTPVLSSSAEDTTRIFELILQSGERATLYAERNSKAYAQPFWGKIQKSAMVILRSHLSTILASLFAVIILLFGATFLPQIKSLFSEKTTLEGAPAPAQSGFIATTAAPKAPHSLPKIESALRTVISPYSGAPTLRELWSTRVFDDTPEVVAKRMQTSPDIPIPLTDKGAVGLLLHAISDADEPAIAATSARISEAAIYRRENGPEAKITRSLITPSAQGDIPLEHLIHDMAQSPWTTAQLAAWMRRLEPAAKTLGDAKLARLAVASATASGQTLDLQDGPWAPPPDPKHPPLVMTLRRYVPILAGLISALAGLGLWLRASLNVRGFLEKKRPSQSIKVVDLLFNRRDTPQSMEKAFRRIAQALSQDELQSTELDIAQTIKATAKGFGLFTPAYREIKRMPSYLFLVDNRSRGDHYTEQLRRNIEGLGQQQVDIRLMLFERWPDRVRPHLGAPSQTLTSVAARDCDRRLVLVGDAEALSASENWRKSTWRRLLDQWQIKAFIPTRPQKQWTANEYAVADDLGMPLSGLSLDRLSTLHSPPGFGDVGQSGHLSSIPVWLRSDRDIWLDDRVPPAELTKMLDKDLLLALGYHGLRWLRACAVFPSIHWDLTQTLGEHLLDEAGRPLNTQVRSANLAMLPWLRASEMPEWLRERLISGIEPADATAIRQHLVQVLDQARHSTGSAEGRQMNLSFGVDGYENLTSDRQFVRFVLRAPRQLDKTSLEATRRLRELLDVSVWRRLIRFSALKWLLLGSVLSVIAAKSLDSLDGLPLSAPIILALSLLAVVASLSLGLSGLAVLRGAAGLFAEIFEPAFDWFAHRIWKVENAFVRAQQETGRASSRRIRIFFFTLMLFFGFCILVIINVRISLFSPVQTVQANSDVSSRADLVDRNGQVLTTTVSKYNMFLDASQLNPAEQARTQAQLATRLPNLPASIVEKIMASHGRGILVRALSAAEYRLLRRDQMRGITFQIQKERDYPLGTTGAAYIGTSQRSGSGLSGAERAFESEIVANSSSGRPVQLAMDLRVQGALENELRREANAQRAKGAVGIVTNIQTGELLAMASWPDFDPNHPGTYSDSELRNRAAADLYEFGSVFKVISMAAAFDSGMTTLNTVYDARQPLQLGNRIIHDNGEGLLTPEDVFIRASNIGMARMALDMGPLTLSNYYQKYGLFAAADTELNESAQPLLPARWTQDSAVSTAFGTGMAISPLSFAQAAGAVLNGGCLRAITMKKVVLQSGVPCKRVNKAATSNVMLDFMRRNVLVGTGARANVPGLRVGGKTGSAQKIVGGRYGPELLSSFAAVFPTDTPIGSNRYLVFILYDSPQGDGASQGLKTGAFVAAPVAGRVIDRIAPFLGVARKEDKFTSTRWDLSPVLSDTQDTN